MRLLCASLVAASTAYTIPNTECKTASRGCANYDDVEMGASYDFYDQFPDKYAQRCMEKCEENKEAGCVGFVTDLLIECILVNAACTPDGDQNIPDEDMTAWHYFSLEACSDGSKSLVAGTCTNLDSDNNPIWSNYVSLNKARRTNYNDAENLSTIYGHRIFGQPAKLEANGFCDTKEKVTGIKAIVGGGRSVITYDQKYAAKTFQNVELSLENGLNCDHANQEEKDGRKRCDDYSIAVCCQATSNWNQWSAWGACDKKCGGGMMERTRDCSNDLEGVGCPNEQWLSSKSQKKECNKQPCVLLNAKKYRGDWYNKCYLSGDPHIRTFDNIWIDVMQYNQMYNVVNAYDKSGGRAFLVTAHTTGSAPRWRDPRAQFNAFHLTIDGKSLFLKTVHKDAYYSSNSASGPWTKMAPMLRTLQNVKVAYFLNSFGNLEFPEYGLAIKFVRGYGEILVRANDDYTFKGYCGNRDYDPNVELELPLSSAIYGSTTRVYSPNQCNGRKPGGLPFRTCGTVAEGRRRRDVEVPRLSSRERRSEDNFACPGSQNAEADCQVFLDAYPDCQRTADAAEIQSFMDVCAVDLCFSNGSESKQQQLDLIRQICADQGVKNGAQIEMQCEKAAEIQEQLTGKAPTCEAGKTYDGCATECSYITCEMAVENDNNWEPTDKCEDNGVLEAGCVCPKDRFLLNGKCVEFDACLNEEWSDWGEYGLCDDDCSFGSAGGQKTRSRFHMTTGEVEDETTACQNDCQQSNEAFQVLEFGETNCRDEDGYQWSSTSQVDDMGATCTYGAVGKWGTLGGSHETKFVVSGFESLKSKFTCNNEDQVRGFECGEINIKYCCKKEPIMTIFTCATGEQKSKDGKFCTSIADANKYCPSSTCWTYENDKCVLKTDKQANDANCALYLSCQPEKMDFRFNEGTLLGDNTIQTNANNACPVLASTGKVGDVDPVGVDKMWNHKVASCDSTIHRETVDDKDFIVVTKNLEYRGDNQGMTLGSIIYLDDAATVTIKVCCRFLASHSASSDDIAINAGSAVSGKLEAQGSWADSLKIEFTDTSFANKLPDSHVTILGTTHYIKVSWTVGAATNPIAKKLNWYISDCTVSNPDNSDQSVKIIENQCFADVVDTKKSSATMLSSENFRFTFRSFSFNDNGNGKQKISCDVVFCLKDSECANETDPADSICIYASPHKWKNA